MIDFKSFTLKEDRGLLKTLKTICGASTLYDPKSGGTHPKVEEFIGLWDTGATGTVITKKVVDKLKLKPIGKTKVYHANGEDTVNVYAINLYLPNGVAFGFVRVTEGILNEMDLLIGMDIITQGDFSVTNVKGKTTFSFRIPSVKEIDYVAEHNNLKKKMPTPKTSRSDYKNQPCSCGSGKPYRKCHGRKK